MPSPSDFKDKESFISECIRINIKEGLDQNAASGKCYGIREEHSAKKVLKGFVNKVISH